MRSNQRIGDYDCGIAKGYLSLEVRTDTLATAVATALLNYLRLVLVPDWW